METAEHRADLVPEHPAQGHRGGIDEDDVRTHLPGRGCDLGTDPAGADHRHAAGVADGVAEPAGIAEVAEVVDTAQVGPGDVDAPRLGAGRQDGGGERQRLVAVESDLALVRVEVEALDGAPHQELDVVVCVEAVVVDAGRLGRRLAAQHGFGQRGSLVGQLPLVADEDDATVEACGAGAFGRLGAGQAGADDDEGRVECHAVGSARCTVR